MIQNIDKILQDLGTALKNSAAQGGSTSRGIVDTATREQIIVSNEGVQTGVLTVERVSGNLKVDQAVTAVSGNFDTVKASKIEADVLQVKRVVSDQAEESFDKSVTFSGNLDGKGLLWADGDLTRQLVFKSYPRKIFSTETIDLYKGSRYQIDGADVLEKTRLGNSVLHSNLTTVGTLEDLSVSGNVQLGEYLYINAGSGRLGLNTDQPVSAINIVEFDTNIVIGADDEGSAFAGTWSNHPFSIVTDSTKRITQTGNVTEIGSAQSKNAVVKIYGTLEVDSIVADTRVERTAPIEFTVDKDNNIYGKGLAWKGAGVTKQLFFMPNPDRIYSSENIDLAIDHAYFINRNEVLSRTELGKSVTKSSLTQLGELTSLTVIGNVNLDNSLVIEDHTVTLNNSISIKDGTGIVRITGTGVTANESYQTDVNNITEFKISQDAIQIGNRDNTERNLNAYGQVSINITNPTPGVAFSVAGKVELDGKKFSNGTSAPTTGAWNKGDIVWNTNPQETSYIGWVCVLSGNPGDWKPFGYIGER